MTHQDSLKHKIYVPSNIKKFLFDYEHSKFIECNRTMAEINRNSNKSYRSIQEEKEKKISVCLAYILNQLDSNYKRFWMVSGTMLGWYRDCGVIPFTTDADFSMYADDFDLKTKELFFGNKLLYLYMSLGLRQSNFELRLSGCSFVFDLFLSYKKHSLTKQCNYYHADKIYEFVFLLFF